MTRAAERARVNRRHLQRTLVKLGIRAAEVGSDDE